MVLNGPTTSQERPTRGPRRLQGSSKGPRRDTLALQRGSRTGPKRVARRTLGPSWFNDPPQEPALPGLIRTHLGNNNGTPNDTTAIRLRIPMVILLMIMMVVIRMMITISVLIITTITILLPSASTFRAYQFAFFEIPREMGPSQKHVFPPRLFA